MNRYSKLGLGFCLGLCLSTTAAANPETYLSREALVRQVLAQNPTIEVARQTWIQSETQVAAAGARKDPVLRLGLMPSTLGNVGGPGHSATLSQALEWPGKRDLRENSAFAEAQKQRASFEQVQLHLIWKSRQIFENYTTLLEALAINGRHQKALAELGLSAEAHYTAGHGAQSAPLQVQVEQALLAKERIALHAKAQSLGTQLNGLLHRGPNTPVMPPTPRIEAAKMPASYPPNATSHPQLQAQDQAIFGAQHKVSLAHKAKRPDFTVSATTESMPGVDRSPLRVGVALNLPVNQRWRRAQITGTQAALQGAQARHAQIQSDLQVEQQLAWLDLKAAIAQSQLYSEQIHPAAEQQLGAAEAGYIAGQEEFIVVLLAQRQRFRLELDHKKAIAESWKAWASLQLALGTRPNTNPNTNPDTKGGAQ
jgi:cobalt-zinc-cadmium efflux system outer membrane protein